ncbi:uncharacterized protein LOC125648339 isoform X1 [Ostrea edulis]|uniref:uncharacterized protein LOC125648339 isoform X1 n=1 Tax=Ostrea edulis TaxID=37623 RepID=UPI0020944D60|nr:uncharacterized protein LOC125648339 isoform X1 [Ostrea edulis]XP_048731289.1 uncharacterized protein LOC125648339 isoform X1 [Ostrea edulis]
MNCYQKFYTNQIHSSSLLCQLATMWKSQVLCDAVIRTGSVVTKAHRVVLVAACPMLQSMDNASMGSHLEVRLAADIKQDSINTFLQYLYEGFMMLTEENCRDVEKIARLLQVDSVIKCCADFQKCLNVATGTPVPMDSQYKYTSYDMLEFRHVRSSGLQKSVNMKRMSNFPRPPSPGSKRQRLGRPSSPHIDSHSSSHRADDTLSMAHSYRSNQPDPWERVPRLGSGTRLPTQPGVIDIVEDCLEIIQTEEPEKDARGNTKPDSRPKQKSVSIGVSSQMNTATDVHVVNVTDSGGSVGPPKQATTNGSRGSITVNPLAMFNDPPSSQGGQRPVDSSNDVQFSPRSNESETTRKENFVHAMTPPQQPVFPTMTPLSRTSNKPFAAGSATQVPTPESGAKSHGESEEGDQVQEPGNKVESEELSPASSADKAPDISIVKVETGDGPTGGLDMYVDMHEDGMIRTKVGMEDGMENEEESDPEHDQSQELRDDISNEASNVSGDQNNSWYIGQFKGLSGGNHDVQDGCRIVEGPTDEGLAVKLFRGWLAASNVSQSFENFQGAELNDLLYRFYVESCNRHLDAQRLKEVRDGIFWHLSGFNSTWNRILQDDSTFLTSNDCLESLNSRENSTTKVKLPHNKVPMLHEDIKTLMTSGLLTNSNPIGLFRKVWFDLAIHLGIGGQAGMRGLSDDSFVAEFDDKGRKYYRLNRNINVDKSRSCMEMQYWCWESRMYEISEDANCPVKTLDLYLEKRNPHKKAFFQRPKSNFSTHCGAIWFESPVGHSSLACMMSRMSEEAGLKRIYTNSSVRYTLADLVEQSGYTVEEVLGQNPRNKTSKSVIILPPSSLTSDEHRNNSNLIHGLFYGSQV